MMHPFLQMLRRLIGSQQTRTVRFRPPPHQGRKEKARRVSQMERWGQTPDAPPFEGTATQEGPQFHRADARRALRQERKKAQLQKSMETRRRDHKNYLKRRDARVEAAKKEKAA